MKRQLRELSEEGSRLQNRIHRTSALLAKVALERPYKECLRHLVSGCFSENSRSSLSLIQSGKTPWVDSACADCPGFLVPGSAPVPGFHLGLGASDCSPGIAFCFAGPWTLLGSAARSSPTTRARKGRSAHTCLHGTGEAHAEDWFAGPTSEESVTRVVASIATSLLESTGASRRSARA